MILKIRSDIYWSSLFLLILRAFQISEEIYLLLSISYLILLGIKLRHLYIPKISGLGMYSIFFIYVFVIGLIINTFRDVMRDSFYILSTIVWIIIGYYLSINNQKKDKILKTLYLYGGINSLICIFQIIFSLNFSFVGLKEVFERNVYDIGFIIVLLIYDIYFNKKCIFGKKFDKFLFFIMILQIGLSFGRIAILQPLITLTVLFMLEFNNKQYKVRILKLMTSFLLVILLFISIFLYIIPEEITMPFIEKILNSFQEIQHKQQILSVTDAMNNWRAYEMQAAIKSWKNSGLLFKIFGYGLGRGTTIEYIPYNWGSMGITNQIPLLHNGFYTLLSKGGLFGVFALIWIFIGNIIRNLKMMRISKIHKSNRLYQNSVIIIAICCGAIANTYVVRGPIQGEPFLVWAILLGSISAESNYIYHKKIFMSEKKKANLDKGENI